MSTTDSSGKAMFAYNVVKSNVSQDGSMPIVKNNGRSKGVVAKEQENRSYVNPKDAFLRPAQRPPKSLLSSTSMNHIRSASNDSQAPTKQSTFSKRGRLLAVYNDKPSEVEKPVTMQSTVNNASRAYATAKGDSQRQKKGQDWAVKDHLSEVHTRDSPKHSQAGDHSSTRQMEEDVTEAIYIDAVEQLPSEKRPVTETENMDRDPLSDYQENIPTQWHSPKLGDSVAEAESTVVNDQAADEVLPDYEEDPAEAGALQSAPVSTDNQTDLSDYEDEDYYDEQGYTTAHSFRDNTTGGVTMVMVPPKLTKKGVAELEAAKHFVVEKYVHDSQDEFFDIGMVAEYGEEIFSYMKEMEATLVPNPHYMDIQNDIQWSMRSVLVDWVVQVHQRFGLLPETLFLAVHFIDRFLSVKVVSMTKLQLVGATALLLAAKYEEINCPSVTEMVYMVDGGYAQEDLIKAERFMLGMLNFALGWPGPMSFMRRISKADDYDSEIRTVAKYLAEITLMDERFVSSPPSYVAAGAQCLARMLLKKGDWTPEHVHYSGYTFSQLKPLLATIFDCCVTGRKHHLAVYDKYSTRQFKRASVFVEEQLDDGFKLPFQHRASYSTLKGPFDEDTVPHSMGIPIPSVC
ncbi:cyclin-like protein [Jackrogersella minutella]|nr:cyclin-like protein [Jackrogersella minutella]